MAYRQNRSRPSATSRKTVHYQYHDAEGQPGMAADYTESIGPTDDADCAEHVVLNKTALACGCYWPRSNVDIAGQCEECARRQAKGRSKSNPNVCQNHFVVCACGAALCWRHSFPSDKDPATRLCKKCHGREKREAFWADVWSLFKSLCRGGQS